MRIFNEKSIIQFLQHEKEDKTGYLWKKRTESKKSSKKRYFVLCGNILVYFEKRLDKEPLGVIFLEGHYIEMLDDFTMAIRFPSTESCSSYILRAEYAAEIEVWMRALSRCSSDFIQSTLEDLEDHVKALGNTYASNTTFPALEETFKVIDELYPAGRVNPFNNTLVPNMPSTSAKQSPPREASRSVSKPLPSIKSTRPAPPPPPRRKPVNAPDSTEMVGPQQHVKWLFSKSWQELHSFAGLHFKEKAPQDSSSPPTLAALSETPVPS